MYEEKLISICCNRSNTSSRHTSMVPKFSSLTWPENSFEASLQTFDTIVLFSWGICLLCLDWLPLNSAETS